MASKTNNSRRHFLGRALTIVGGAALGSLITACDGGGQPTPPPAPKPAPKPEAKPEPAPAPTPQPAATTNVDPNDQLAKQLGYVENIAEADTSAIAAFKEGSNCANCSLYQGKEGEEAGPCTIFQGKNVKAAGWCQSWAPKA
ncbi:MAG: high-potential iron-sulfur protein [Myxococcota bacterium]